MHVVFFCVNFVCNLRLISGMHSVKDFILPTERLFAALSLDDKVAYLLRKKPNVFYSVHTSASYKLNRLFYHRTE